MAHELDIEAAALVAAVNPAEVAAMIAQYIPAEDVPLRNAWRGMSRHPVYSDNRPKEPQKLLVCLSRELEKQRESAQAAVRSYCKYRRDGLQALSAYDVLISSGRNPLRALKTALDLTQGHVSYYMSLAADLALDIANLRELLTPAPPPQLSLF